MSLYDDCPTDNHQETSAAAAGGVMEVNWNPDTGELWEVDYVDVFHNDAAAPSGSWLFTDGTTLLQLGDGSALAASTRRALYGATLPHKLHLDHRCTLSWKVSAGATNGATATMNIVGRRIRGTQ